MKDQATHIRLIRDENGKPFEAKYENPFSAESHPLKWDEFEEWAYANRIPATGDWPDREIFAMEEVEPVFIQTGRTSNGYGATGIEKLRLKAKQEPNGQEPWVVNPGGMVLDSDKDGIPIITLEQKEQMKRDGWVFEEEPKQEEQPISEKQLAYLWTTAREFESLSDFLDFLKRTEYPINPENSTQLSDKIQHVSCDPEALKDPEFVSALNQTAELAFNMSRRNPENPTGPRPPKKNFENATDFPLSAPLQTNEPPQTDSSSNPTEITPQIEENNANPGGNDRTSLTYLTKEKETLIKELKSLLLEFENAFYQIAKDRLEKQIVTLFERVFDSRKEGENRSLKNITQNAHTGEPSPDQYVTSIMAIAGDYEKGGEYQSARVCEYVAKYLLSMRPAEDKPFTPPRYGYKYEITRKLASEYRTAGKYDVSAWETETGLRIITSTDSGQTHLQISHPDRIPTRDEVVWARYEFGKGVENMGEILTPERPIDDKSVHLWEIKTLSFVK